MYYYPVRHSTPITWNDIYRYSKIDNPIVIFTYKRCKPCTILHEMIMDRPIENIVKVDLELLCDSDKELLSVIKVPYIIVARDNKSGPIIGSTYDEDYRGIKEFSDKYLS